MTVFSPTRKKYRTMSLAIDHTKGSGRRARGWSQARRGRPSGSIRGASHRVLTPPIAHPLTAARGRSRGRTRMERGQTPRIPRKRGGAFQAPDRASLSPSVGSRFRPADWGRTGSWGRGRERPPPNLTIYGTGEGAGFHGDFHVTTAPGGVAPYEIIPAGRLSDISIKGIIGTNTCRQRAV